MLRAQRCTFCGDELPGRGRIDRKYCRASCRTLAFRRRHQQPESTDPDAPPQTHPPDPRLVVTEVLLRLEQLIGAAQRELGIARTLLAQLNAAPPQGAQAQTRQSDPRPAAATPRPKARKAPKPRPQPVSASATDWEAEAESFVAELQQELLHSPPAMQGNPVQSLSAQRRIFLKLVALSGAFIEAELTARGPARLPELIRGTLTHLKERAAQTTPHSATLLPWLQRNEQAAQQILLILCMKKFSDPAAAPLYVIVEP